MDVDKAQTLPHGHERPAAGHRRSDPRSSGKNQSGSQQVLCKKAQWMNEPEAVGEAHPPSCFAIRKSRPSDGIDELCLTCALQTVSCNGAAWLAVPAFHPSPQEACDKLTDEHLRWKAKRFSTRRHVPVASKTCGALPWGPVPGPAASAHRGLRGTRSLSPSRPADTCTSASALRLRSSATLPVSICRWATHSLWPTSHALVESACPQQRDVHARCPVSPQDGTERQDTAAAVVGRSLGTHAPRFPLWALQCLTESQGSCFNKEDGRTGEEPGSRRLAPSCLPSAPPHSPCWAVFSAAFGNCNVHLHSVERLPFCAVCLLKHGGGEAALGSGGNESEACVPPAVQHMALFPCPDGHGVSRPSRMISNWDAFRLTVPGLEQLSEGGAFHIKGRAGVHVRWFLCASIDATNRHKEERASQKEKHVFILHRKA